MHKVLARWAHTTIAHKPPTGPVNNNPSQEYLPAFCDHGGVHAAQKEESEEEEEEDTPPQTRACAQLARVGRTKRGEQA